MPDNRKDTSKQAPRKNQEPAPGFNSDEERNNTQKSREPHPLREDLSAVDLSKIDRQEGEMDNGELGGNFKEDNIEKDYSIDSPPH